MTESIRDVAARCLRDPMYTRWLLEGDAYPEVREAILADLQVGSEVQGFFNPQPVATSRVQAFVHGIGPSWGQWNGLAPTHLARLAGMEPVPVTGMPAAGEA